jgi:hypothetical protein
VYLELFEEQQDEEQQEEGEEQEEEGEGPLPPPPRKRTRLTKTTTKTTTKTRTRTRTRTRASFSSTNPPTTTTRRVGLRCVYCRDDPPGAQAKMAAFLPKSLASIYKKTCDWQRVHFRECPRVPEEERQEYERLKAISRRGQTQWWERSAALIGLEDVKGEGGRPGGIRFGGRTG